MTAEEHDSVTLPWLTLQYGREGRRVVEWSNQDWREIVKAMRKQHKHQNENS